MVPDQSQNSDPNVDDYTSLKNVVIDQLENASLSQWESVLNRYSAILSIRTRSRLLKSPNLRDLMKILENRDCLSAENVQELIDLAEFLKRYSLGSDICQYQKLRAIQHGSPHAECRTCGENIREWEATYTVNNHINAPPTQQCACQTLDAAIALVSPCIIKTWPKVARELDFQEGRIDELENNAWDLEEEKGVVCAAQQIISQMFEEWKETQRVESRTADVGILKKALKKARLPDAAALLD